MQREYLSAATTMKDENVAKLLHLKKKKVLIHQYVTKNGFAFTGFFGFDTQGVFFMLKPQKLSDNKEISPKTEAKAKSF